MNLKEIKELLDRYWMCQTSVEEEQLLKDFFSQKSVPEEFVEYRSIFLLQCNLKMVKAGESMRQFIALEVGMVDKKRKHHHIHFYPALKVAASILIVFAVGVGMYTHYQQEVFIEETFSETYTSPEDAIIETRAALGKIAVTLSKKQALSNDSSEIDSTEDDTIQAN